MTELIFFLVMFAAFVSIFTMNRRISTLEDRYTILAGILARVSKMKEEEFENE